MKPSPKTAYRDICRHAAQATLFHQPWWLDAACGPGNWQVAIARNENTGEVEGALPYHVRSRFGVKIVAPPPLTPFLGPLLCPPEGLNHYKLRAFEEALAAQLLSELPRLPAVRLKLHYDVHNWLPFRQVGFRQTTRYSYRILDLSDIEAVWASFHPKLRNKINHAARFCQVQQIDDAGPVFQLFERRFQQKGQAAPIHREWFAGVDQALMQRQARAAFLCSDRAGRPLAGAYIAWDQYSSYLLLTGFDEQANIRGAAALAVWASIQFVAERGLIYDFEGSMLPGVERFFREFGGELCSYHRLAKYRNRMWEVLFHTIRK
ncbi:MAG: GNAT family N-acetyltransferase [Lewinellaceae bacterium]|nr:GNAT family N-acetyltransferase [Phaeodactylibacter sp.]MCB9352637.1 GNAT family N-acetyltransferase [Lewinellaceae bacterium]